MISSADHDPIRTTDLRDLVWKARHVLPNTTDLRDLVWKARHVLPNTTDNRALIARAERGDGDAMERLSGRLEGRR